MSIHVQSWRVILKSRAHKTKIKKRLFKSKFISCMHIVAVPGLAHLFAFHLDQQMLRRLQ